MNILITAPEDDNRKAYIHLLSVADYFNEMGHTVIFATTHKYYQESANISLEKYKVYYYNDEHTIEDNGNENLKTGVCSYPTLFRLQCWGAKRELKHYISKLNEGLVDKLISFFKRIIVEESIDFILYENISDIFFYCAYFAARELKKSYIGWITSRIPGRYELWTDPFGNIEERKELFEINTLNSISESEKNEILGYINSIVKIKPDYMKNNASSMEINYFKYYFNHLAVAYRKMKAMITVNRKDSVTTRYPLDRQISIVKYKMTRKSKIKKLQKRFMDVDENDKFFIFPMHYQPESSISVIAPMYSNQAEVIKNVSLCLPKGTFLYVKDHPNGIGFMSMERYEEILNLPKVKYISPNENNEWLFMHCLGLITISSTMGYEALLYGRPVVTFGKVFYNFHPDCIHIEGYEKLFQVLNEIKNNKKSIELSNNIRFVKTYRDTTFDGQLFDTRKESVSSLANNIIKVANDFYHK